MSSQPSLIFPIKSVTYSLGALFRTPLKVRVVYKQITTVIYDRSLVSWLESIYKMATVPYCVNYGRKSAYNIALRPYP